MRGARIVDDLLPVADQNVARVGVVVAHDAFDQRALAGAVLAEERVEGAGFTFSDTLIERGERAEALGDADRFDAERFAVQSLGARSRDDLDELRESDTAPNTPPCILIILSAWS